ncbi:type II toxin-antitoxin system HicB family antitoxin [Acidobacteria bacterium AH-259-O06]|nr:type II toxin-antitoxin system HicB family antitoxin [Acidobacteria bacterium AH-259-O06]
MMEYKGYRGIVEFDDEAGIFHGEVINTRDAITFQGKSMEEIQQSFKDSIADYLEFCAERGEKPEKPFSGKFVVRLTADQHRKVFLAAKKQNKSLNTWVAQTLEREAEQVVE